MKHLVFSGLSVLLLTTATAPAFAADNTNESNIAACQSIPPEQPTGGGSRERLDAIERCQLEVIIRQQRAVMAQMKALESQMQTMMSQMELMKKSVNGQSH